MKILVQYIHLYYIAHFVIDTVTSEPTEKEIMQKSIKNMKSLYV